MRPKLFLPLILSSLALTHYSPAKKETGVERPDGEASAPGKIELAHLSTYRGTGGFDEGISEIIAYHPGTQSIYSINAKAGGLDIIDVSDLTATKLKKSVSFDAGDATCVAARENFVVVTVAAKNPQKPGSLYFLSPKGGIAKELKVGALPDNVAISKDSRWVITANEGEPSDDYKTDPEGTVSLIEIKDSFMGVTQEDVTTIGFGDLKKADLDPSIRVFGLAATIAQDLEPEYVRFNADATRAYVALQENNAVAIIDVPNKKLIGIKGLGYVDHSRHGNGFDSSDKSDSIDITPHPTKGMFQPDAFAVTKIAGSDYLVLANEGDSRDYDGFSEEVRVEDLKLDPGAFPNAEELQKPDNLGRLKVTNTLGDTDGDGDFDELYSFGTRSFSIRDADLNLVYDSGNDLAKQTLKALSERPDIKGGELDYFKGRSDDKGVEPEAVAIGKIDGKTYAFIGLERLGGVAAYDISDPKAASFVTYANNRNFKADIESPEAGDIAPECILFIPADESPNGKPLLIVSNEVSGTISIFEIR